MLRRFPNWLKFQVEVFLLRGAVYPLIAIAMLVAFIALFAGALALALGVGFSGLGEATWWAFLRLTDPGYLGDDEGLTRRAISGVVTVLGYVVFLGALVAIMTQWFHGVMARLQAGLTPIVQRQHVVVLGWTNRSATIVHELLSAEGPVRRFLRKQGTRRLRVVVLSEENPAKVTHDLRSHLEELWDPARLIVRSGSPLRSDHLQRVDVLNASVVVIPAEERSAAPETTADSAVIKALLTISETAAQADRPPPPVVVELVDARKVALARRAYPGKIEIVSSDSFVGRVLAQSLWGSGVSRVFTELLDYEHGNELYLPASPDLVGLRFDDLGGHFPTGIPVGLSRPDGGRSIPLMCPPADTVVASGDRVIVIAEDEVRAAPLAVAVGGEDSVTGAELPPYVSAFPKRVLILGWNHNGPMLLRELDSYPSAGARVDILSRTPPKEREELMDLYAVHPQRLQCQHVDADFTSPSDLADFKPGGYDAILLLASDWTQDDASTDARTVLGYLVLDELLGDTPDQPPIVVELRDPDSRRLFRKRVDDVVVSPVMVSQLLTQVALRRELGNVYDELFSAEGARIHARPAGKTLAANRELTFAQLQRICQAEGMIALGVRTSRSDRAGSPALRLNPPRREPLGLRPDDGILVMSRDPGHNPTP